MTKSQKNTPLHSPLPNLIFASRWLQLPLYLGLIAGAGGVRGALSGRAGAPDCRRLWQPDRLQALVTSIGYKTTPITALNETVIMLVVLALIDVVMISNLLIMVIVGGYETFVSRMNLRATRPARMAEPRERLVLKVKLATAIIGISSIHLLKTFINADNYTGPPDRADHHPHHLCCRPWPSPDRQADVTGPPSMNEPPGDSLSRSSAGCTHWSNCAAVTYPVASAASRRLVPSWWAFAMAAALS